MDSQAQNLRTTQADGQPDVNLTLEELMAEIDREVKILPMIQDDDLTRAIYAARHGITEKSAANLLENLVARGVLARTDKRMPNGSTIATYRKAGS